MASSSGPVAVPAEARVFGHDPVRLELRLTPRTTGWRAARAALYLVVGAVLAVVLGLLPPHAPWIVAAGVGGVVLGLRKWNERFTLEGVEGRCPRCGEPLGFEGSTPLRSPHRLSCDACGNPVVVHVETEVLPEP